MKLIKYDKGSKGWDGEISEVRSYNIHLLRIMLLELYNPIGKNSSPRIIKNPQYNNESEFNYYVNRVDCWHYINGNRSINNEED